MNWILNHLQVVIALAAGFAYWINQWRGKAGAGRNAVPGAGKFDAAPSEAEDAERTRRIQDEIRRKIAERRGAESPPILPATTSKRPLATPTVAPQPVAESGMGGGLRERLEAKLAQMQAREKARVAAQERQQELAAQARSGEAEELAVQRRAAEAILVAREEARVAVPVQTAPETLTARHSRAWLDDLRDPQSARRAMVLREVLGPPVGLR